MKIEPPVETDELNNSLFVNRVKKFPLLPLQMAAMTKRLAKAFNLRQSRGDYTQKIIIHKYKREKEVINGYNELL